MSSNLQLQALPQSQSGLQPTLASIKAQQRVAWSAGNYAVVGTTLQIVGELLCEALDVRAGDKVLDVAAGNGNATLAAARRWCDVTSTDYVAQRLQAGRARAEAEGLAATFLEADAESLPFEDGEFDVVLSTFGVMFAPDQDRAAAELARVCRPAGKIGLAAWTPAGFTGQVSATIGRYVPAPAILKSPMLWGTPERVQQLFEPLARKIHFDRREFCFRYRSIEHWLDVCMTCFGPMQKAFAVLDSRGRQALARELTALADVCNRSGDDTFVVPAEYLQIVVKM